MLEAMLGRIKTDAEWFGMRRIKNHGTALSCRNGLVEPLSMGQDEGFRLELLHKGQFVYVGFQEASQLQQALDKAHDLSARACQFPLYHFTSDQRPKVSGHYDQSMSLGTPEYQEWISLLQKADQKLKAGSNIIDSRAFLSIQNAEEDYVSSSGARVHQKRTLFLHGMSATASKNNIIQTRTNGSPCTQNDITCLDPAFMEQSVEMILQEVNELVDAENCPSGKMDLILHPDQLYLQIHESIGHPLELDRILGDERNYAGWSFVNVGDFGTLQYGSPLMNVTFDPTVQGETASYQFDDAGNLATREYLIKDGRLERPLGSLESQVRSGLKGVANARSTSWNRPPLDRMANINLEPGSSTLQEMIEGTERGIYMKTNNSWSIDDYRRKFQFGCEYGQLIENGKLTKIVRNPNYRGETLSFWHNLTHVGNDTQVSGSFYCGKGEPNQVITVGHAMPHAKFSEIDVFGGQA